MLPMVRLSPPTRVISAWIWQYGTRADKAKLYKIDDKVVKINQAINNLFRGLYFTYCFGSRLNSP